MKPSLPRFKLASLLALVTLQACSGSEVDETPTPEALEATRGALTTHVYVRPSTPTAYYAPPTTNVLFVATTGNDSTGTGSETAPYLTLGKAIAVVNAKAAGPLWTIVLKGGTYREGELTLTRDNVTLQRHGSEFVSLRGSVPLTGFSGTSAPYTKAITSPDPTPLEQNCADDSLLGGTSRHYGAEFG